MVRDLLTSFLSLINNISWDQEWAFFIKLIMFIRWEFGPKAIELYQSLLTNMVLWGTVPKEMEMGLLVLVTNLRK